MKVRVDEIGVRNQLEVGREFVLEAGVEQAKGFAVLVTLMRVEEHEDALVPEVALTKSASVEAVDLGIGQDVADTLQVNNHHEALS